MRSGQRPRGLIAVAVIAVAVSGFGAASAGAAKQSSFKPGLYVGQTSQGQPVKLRVRGCGGKSCLESPVNVDLIVELTCPSQEPTEEAVHLTGAVIPASGTVKVNESGFAKTLATYKVGHGGTLTGQIRSTETLTDGARCDSGNVTLKAKVGGSTR